MADSNGLHTPKKHGRTEAVRYGLFLVPYAAAPCHQIWVWRMEGLGWHFGYCSFQGKEKMYQVTLNHYYTWLEEFRNAIKYCVMSVFYNIIGMKNIDVLPDTFDGILSPLLCCLLHLWRGVDLIVLPALPLLLFEKLLINFYKFVNSCSYYYTSKLLLW